MSFLHNRPSPPSVFPTYLLPSLPFRRRTSRQGSADSDTSKSSTTSSDKSSDDTATTEPYLHGHISHLRCSRCSTDLCLTSQIISKGFTGRHGRAYLVSATPASSISTTAVSTSPNLSLPNTYTHKAVPRQLVTGAHTVSDISCVFCGSVLGWKYVAADEEGQRYKVGKFILETKRIAMSSCWENFGNGDGGEKDMPPVSLERGGNRIEDGIEFDSQDEDECEDLFAGVWSPALAARRRRGRRFGRSTTTDIGQRARSEEYN